MSGGIIKLKKDQILFNDGDDSDAMYVIKAGRIAITKAKGKSEIVLAELVTGEMLGEMAFFDNKPRSAGAKAMLDSEVIALPFSALHAQFKTFPEWLKAMVKTVNSHLRSANQRIKNLEQAHQQDTEVFDPHSITRYCAILCLIGFKAGEKEEGGLVIPSGLLRNYTIQVFQQPTHKMQKLLETLQTLNLSRVEELGEGKQKITLLNHEQLSSFVDWYNKWLFTDTAKRVEVTEKELPILGALIFYGRKAQKDERTGQQVVNLTQVQNESMKDLNYLVQVNDVDSLCKKELIGEKTSGEGGIVTTAFDLEKLEEIEPYWRIIYTLRKVQSG